MHAPPRPILLMHPSASLAEAVRAAVDGEARVWPVEGWDALERALVRLPPTALVIVDPCDPEAPDALAPRLEALLVSLRSATVVAAFPVTPGTADHLDRLARWGVADVVDVGREDTPVALRRRLRMVQGRLVARLLDRALPRATSGRARALLASAAGTAAAGGGSAELAASLGATERTVLRWCRRADLPDPRRLLTWLRVLLAADMLDDPGRTLDQVARACGYSGDAALRNAVRGLLGSPPSALRGTAFATAASAFARELFELRDRAHAEGKPEKTWLH